MQLGSYAQDESGPTRLCRKFQSSQADSCVSALRKRLEVPYITTLYFCESYVSLALMDWPIHCRMRWWGYTSIYSQIFGVNLSRHIHANTFGTHFKSYMAWICLTRDGIQHSDATRLALSQWVWDILVKAEKTEDSIWTHASRTHEYESGWLSKPRAYVYSPNMSAPASCINSRLKTGTASKGDVFIRSPLLHTGLCLFAV